MLQLDRYTSLHTDGGKEPDSLTHKHVRDIRMACWQWISRDKWHYFSVRSERPYLRIQQQIRGWEYEVSEAERTGGSTWPDWGRVLLPSARICHRKVGNTKSVLVVTHCGMCVWYSLAVRLCRGWVYAHLKGICLLVIEVGLLHFIWGIRVLAKAY